MATMKSILILLAIIGFNTFAQEINNTPFPDDFLWGVGSSAYQIEGASTTGDKGESIWDYLTKNNPELIIDGSNGDISSDSFNHIDDDVALLKQLGVNFYRFSISWSRVLPTGQSHRISTRGIRYYHDLIDTLVQNDITPVVTMYHWDLPNTLQKLGGWMNPNIVRFFADYADLLFVTYGAKVKHWITFESPNEFCKGYGSGKDAPNGLKLPGIGEYICAYTVLKAHAAAYHTYNDTFRATQQGQIGISLSVTWNQPDSTSSADVLQRAMAFEMGIIAHPIFTTTGNFPEYVRSRVSQRSSKEGFPESRLPELTQEEVEYIRGTADFFGLYHFSSVIASNARDAEIGTPSVEKDIGLETSYNSSWEGSATSWLKVYPQGISSTLAWIRVYYSGYPVLITGNGFSDNGQLEDDARINYHKLYLSAIRTAMDQNANVIGYTAWSLLDQFEWLDGYTTKFGLFQVNFTDPDRPRTAKKSAEYYTEVIKNKVADPPNSTQLLSRD